MAHSFTDEQQRAIDHRAGTLLVSAAAGSGKTATLTGRIIASLTDKTAPSSLSRIVVATFTNASAADMREKISRALAAALEEEPGCRRLRNEQLLMPSARIQTIDSFCGKLLRRYAERAGISPTFRTADPLEERLLGASVMEGLLEDLYGGEVEGVSAEEAAALADALSSPKSEEGVGELLLALYDRVRHDVRGIFALADAREGYAAASAQPFFRTEIGAEVAAHYARVFSDLAAAYDTLLEALVGCRDASLPRRGDFCRREAAELRALAARLLSGEVPRSEELPALGRMPNGAKGDAPENRMLGSVHTEVKAQRDALVLGYLSYTEEEHSRFFAEASRTADLLYRILLSYDERMQAEYARRGILGFLEIERRTLSLLEQDGEPTELARELAAGIDYVYVDEFQDVNALQYRIFRAISRGDNLFMVGDVKQSIYAFRHADPEIFSSLRVAYPPLGEGAEGAPANHFFTRNFRCDAPIVDYVNRVAGGLLATAGGAPYTEEDALRFAKPGAVGEEPVRTHVFQRAKGEGNAAEVQFVAKEIERLLTSGIKNDGTPIRPSDIAVLFRGGAQMAPFAEAIRRIAPVTVSAERDFFKTPEVLLALSLLYVIDNPRRDIQLAAVLRSPVFGLSMEELVLIRTECPAECLYESLLAFCRREGGFEKGEAFLACLADWRRLAEGESVRELMLAVLRDAGLLTLFGEGADCRHDNLFRLYEYARGFEASSYQGLYGFISYINAVIEGEGSFPRAAGEGGEGTVRLMTMHASKGLEFPVVFLVGTEHTFNHRDLTAPLLYDRTHGPSVRFLLPGGRAAAETPIRTWLRERGRRETNREEIRLLYVALTRARERLTVTGSVASLKTRQAAAELALVLPYEWSILSSHNALEMVLPMLLRSHDPYLSLSCAEEKDSFPPLYPFGGEEKPPAPADGELAAALRQRLSFVYPHLAEVSLPEKLSVSRLGTSPFEETAAPLPEYQRTVPAFLAGTRAPSPAERGTATHLFLQFCDLSRLAEGAERELSRLAHARFLTPEDAALVRLDEVEAFCRTPLFARMQAARRLRRELRFHAELPAAALSLGEGVPEGCTVLVQGVIDCILEEEDGYVLIDYKTDRLSSAEREDPALARRNLAERHRAQLGYYAAACHRMYGAPPKEVLVYSLALGEAVPISPLPLS